MSSKLPIVSIVGRQNVGKSTLFNAFIRQKKSIVDSSPGLTRDIISHNVVHNGISFMVCDTPGLDLAQSSELSGQIIENARRHLANSAVILFLMEYPAPESFDHDLANIVRKMSIPAIAVVNKMDSSDRMENMPYFYEMGFREIIPISALRRYNIDFLLDYIVRMLPSKKTAVREPGLKIAITGRPNSGKSTLLNSFVGYERSVVSDIPGTTRDSVDDTFMYHGRLIQIIDTAGIRKKSRITESVEYYSLTRTIEAIHRSDVTIQMIDASVGLTDNDKKISDEIIAAKKPVIIAVNKWDAIEKDHKTFEAFKDRLIFKFFRAADFPIISVSAKSKQRINKLLDTAIELDAKARKRIATPALNRAMAQIKSSARIPQLNEKLRVYYAVQLESIPPQFKLFVNNAEYFKKDVIRYFEKALKEAFGLHGLPIFIQIEGKNRNYGRRKAKS